MSEPWAIFALSFIGMVGTVWGFSIRWTWRIRDMKEEVLGKVETHDRRDSEEFARVREEIELSARAFGETISALREKLNKIELEASQNYVRRDGFWKAHDELKQAFMELRREINEERKELRFDIQRLEKKIDTKS